ncbi:MAG TPA: hypothetical protein VGO11_22430 [Chthoniobacteraceae bacterium]|jgi:hypothetical protein|nr:hypothetical protein [Chthoniobacteraceae bacterium]
MTKLTLEEQREMMRRREEGYRFGNEMQALEASKRTEAEKWRVADQLMEGIDPERVARLLAFSDPEEDEGLVLAQRRFMKIRALQ